jgi:hypothetical protein
VIRCRFPTNALFKYLRAGLDSAALPDKLMEGAGGILYYKSSHPTICILDVPCECEKGKVHNKYTHHLLHGIHITDGFHRIGHIGPLNPAPFQTLISSCLVQSVIPVGDRYLVVFLRRHFEGFNRKPSTTLCVGWS